MCLLRVVLEQAGTKKKNKAEKAEINKLREETRERRGEVCTSEGVSCIQESHETKSDILCRGEVRAKKQLQATAVWFRSQESFSLVYIAAVLQGRDECRPQEECVLLQSPTHASTSVTRIEIRTPVAQTKLEAIRRGKQYHLISHKNEVTKGTKQESGHIQHVQEIRRT